MDHDRLLKELLTTFFHEFLELFFEDIAHLIDRSCLERGCRTALGSWTWWPGCN